MIPTAEEFMNSKNYWHSEDYYSLLIEFAKLHVEAALKAASEKVQLNMYKKSQYSKTSRWKRVSNEEEKEGVDLFNYECQWKPSKKSILNAYPLENIK